MLGWTASHGVLLMPTAHAAGRCINHGVLPGLLIAYTAADVMTEDPAIMRFGSWLYTHDVPSMLLADRPRVLHGAPVIGFTDAHLAELAAAGAVTVPARTPNDVIPQQSLSLDALQEELKLGKTLRAVGQNAYRAAKVRALTMAITMLAGFPFRTNLYVSGHGLAESAFSVHMDGHAFFAVQFMGAKRWRVYLPPHPRRGNDMLFVDERGKGLVRAAGRRNRSDVPTTAPEPLLDIELNPGTVLFVPPGFPHDTSTDGAREGDDISVHATVGCYARRLLIDYAGARYVALVRAGTPPPTNGWVVPSGWAPAGGPRTRAWRGLAGQMLRTAAGPNIEEQAKRLALLTRASEPMRWRNVSNTALDKLLDGNTVSKIIEWHVSNLVHSDLKHLRSDGWTLPAGRPSDVDPYDFAFASFLRKALGGSCVALVAQLGCDERLGSHMWMPATVRDICQAMCRADTPSSERPEL